MFDAELFLIEETYKVALLNQGSLRVFLFQDFGKRADALSKQLIFAETPLRDRFGLSYANLMHNFFGSLAGQLLIDSNRDYLLTCDRWGPQKIAVAEQHNDSVLVNNGRSAMELLRAAVRT